MSCAVGHRHVPDLAFLWLYYRPSDVAPIRPLAWELPDATGEALKSNKQTNKQKKYSNTFSGLDCPLPVYQQENSQQLLRCPTLIIIFNGRGSCMRH